MPAPIVGRDPGDESPEESGEQSRVLTWRFDELDRAGYPTDVALVLAENPDVDLHLAVALLRRGATIHEALRILT